MKLLVHAGAGVIKAYHVLPSDMCDLSLEKMKRCVPSHDFGLLSGT